MSWRNIPTATLECVAQNCPCRITILQSPATRETAFDVLINPCVRSICSRSVAVGLFAATERGFHFFEGREIFLQPIDVLLHLHDGRPEFFHRAEGAPQTRHLRLGRPLTQRPTY